MERFDTDACAETERTGRALVVTIPAQGRAGGTRTRPLAGFLAQLMADADPSLRPARSERTGRAADLYARTGRLARRG